MTEATENEINYINIILDEGGIIYGGKIQSIDPTRFDFVPKDGGGSWK